jgi:phage-related protein
MAEATSKLQILVQLRDEATASIQRLSNNVSDLGGSLNFSADKAGILAGAMSAIAGAAIVTSVSAFADAEAQMASFNTMMATLPPNLQDLKGKMLEVADKALLLGFDNEEASMSLAKLLVATRNGSLTFSAFQSAMDLARLKGISLTDATRAIILAFQGNTRVLKEYGIEVEEHAGREAILEQISRVANGQAKAYSETLKGQIGILKAIGGEAQESLGAVFAPLIENVTHKLIGWIEAQGGINAVLEKAMPFIQFFGALLLGVVVTGAIAATVALGAWVASFGGLILALIAAGIGVMTFVSMVAIKWAEVKEVTMTVWNALKEFFKALWDEITYLFDQAISKIKTAINSVVSAYNSVKSAVGSAVSGVKNVVTSVIPKFANGGIVTSPTIGMIGEAGAEAVIPLDRLGGLGGGGGVVINLNGDFYTDSEIAERFGNELARIIKNQLNLGGIRA